MAITPLNQTMQVIPPARVQGNAAIVKHAAQADISVANKPLELLYRSAIEKLNEYLEPEFGEDAIGQAARSGTDFSPEAVAERIVSFATSAYGAYTQRHGDESQEQQIEGFLDLVGGAIEQGFEEAKEILDGLGVFENKIADNANRTYDLIQEKLAAFAEQVQTGFAGISGEEP